MLHSFLYDHSYYIWYVIIIGLIVEIAANKLQVDAKVYNIDYIFK